MTDRTNKDHHDDDLVSSMLRDALADRFDGVDFDALQARIVGDANARSARAAIGNHATSRAPDAASWRTMARWSARGIPVAATLLAAGVAAIVLLSPAREQPAPAGFWPVAEDLMSTLPADTRLLIDAGTNIESLLTAMLASAEQEGGS
jgi:hypothetical protein